MNNKSYGHKSLSSHPSVALCEEGQSVEAGVVANTTKAVHYQQIALLIKQSLTTNVVEPCLSPLLWSESFGLRLDG